MVCCEGCWVIEKRVVVERRKGKGPRRERNGSTEEKQREKEVEVAP